MMAVAKSSSWRMEDLQDLEQYGLAAELESTNLEGPAEAAGAGGQRERDFGAYNMTEVLSNLLTEDQLLDESFSFSPLGFPSNRDSPASLLLENKSEIANQTDPLSIVLNVPSAFGIKITQDKVTYINKGHSYEVKLQVNMVMANQVSQDTVYKGVLTLGFCEIRLKNSEQEQFELWIKDHPQERLLEVDAMSCDGLSDVQNSDQLLNVISFVWSPLRPATLSFKVNCLSTEFAARKHGGEKGALLRLEMDTFCVDPSNSSSPQHFHRCTCNIKVFKDKGADRKQRQDQLKMEKLPQNDLANYHQSEVVTQFLQLAIPISNIVLPLSAPSTPSSRGVPSGASQYCLTTSPSAVTPQQQTAVAVAAQDGDITTTSSIDQTREWLLRNRFSQYLSLFVNYSGTDLLRLSRRDLVDLCGTADGIRLYNALRTQTVRVLYATFGQEKVFQALCLEQLTARELLTRIAEKLSLSLDNVSTLVRLTSTGILVLVDDIVVHNMRDEESFMVQMIKEEGGRYQIILRDHPYTAHEDISMHGAATRH